MQVFDDIRNTVKLRSSEHGVNYAQVLQVVGIDLMANGLEYSCDRSYVSLDDVAVGSNVNVLKIST